MPAALLGLHRVEQRVQSHLIALHVGGSNCQFAIGSRNSSSG
ncbi:hypothetical protein [Lentzea roselyniae]